MKKIILAAIGAALSLPLLATTQTTTSTTTTEAPAKVKEVTTTTTTREETPMSDQSTIQSMEEAKPEADVSSPSLAPSSGSTVAPSEQREEAEPSFQSAPYEKQKMEDVDVDEDEEFVPGSRINDLDEEEEY